MRFSHSRLFSSLQIEVTLTSDDEHCKVEMFQLVNKVLILLTFMKKFLCFLKSITVL